MCFRVHKAALHAAHPEIAVFPGLLTASPYIAGAGLPSVVPAAHAGHKAQRGGSL